MTVAMAVLDDYQDAAWRSADWSPLDGDVGLTIFHDHLADEDELVERLAPFPIVLAMRERTPFPASLLRRLPGLRLLVTTGMRNAAIDLAAAAELGVTVCGTRGLGTPTPELTWALILGLARHLVPENTGLRAGDGPWQRTVGMDLAGRTLGLVGLGRIGVQVARVATAFGMDVQAWSRNLTVERAEAAGGRLAPSLADLLATSDVVSIHLVLSDRTRGLLDADALKLMRRTAFLVNTSRGPIVDEDALVAALRDGAIAGAGLDVFDTEPLPADHPFRTLQNVLATPHLGYVTEASYATFYADAVEDVRTFLDGAPVRVLGQ